MTSILKAILQILLLSIFSFAGNCIIKYFHLSIPGSILSFFLVLFLFQLKILHLQWLETGANYLISELILFFIPSTVGIVKYEYLLRLEGLQFECIIILSTATVMLCVGFLAEHLAKYKRSVAIHVNK